MDSTRGVPVESQAFQSPGNAVNSSAAPLLSVVIPTRNEERNLEACLHGFDAACAAGWCETIVVDNDSTDATPALTRMREDAEAALKKVVASSWVTHTEGGSIPLARAILTAVSARCALAEAMLSGYAVMRRTGDRSSMSDIPQLIDEAIAAMETLMKEHRHMWICRNRPQGMERMEIRFAASVERLREARRRIDVLLCGTDNEIPELEETLSFEKGPYLYPGFIRLSHSALV